MEKQTKSEEKYEKWGISCIILCFNADIYPKLYFTKIFHVHYGQKRILWSNMLILFPYKINTLYYIHMLCIHKHTHIHVLTKGLEGLLLIKFKPTFSKLIFTTLLFSQNVHHHLTVHTRVCYTVNVDNENWSNNHLAITNPKRKII